MTIRPAWILALTIMVGWIIGIIGYVTQVCPPSITGLPCDSATFYLAQTNAFVVFGHFFYQLCSSIFVTNSLIDAGFNAIAVVILDRFTPPQFNNTRYFSIFFASALAGNLLTLGLGPYYQSAGASGGIFGLYAAVFSYYWAEDKKIDSATLVLFLMIFLGSSFLIPNVNYVAHLGGALAGFISGPLLYYSLRKRLAEYGESSVSLQSTKLIAGFLIAAFLLGTMLQFALFFHA